jgi:lipopolysaccharide/colanic/teichoic acid biosynthesis glycosyltransferase
MVSPGRAIVDRQSRPRSVAAEKPSEELIGVVPSSYFRWKGAIDRVLAALMLAPGLLVIGLLVVLVRLTSAGPAIFRQRRVGKNRRLFTLLKIRTMRIDAEKKTGPAWSQPNDHRTTRLGRILRKLHLDEIPNLINVVRGEMSLVGPRPERPEFVEVLSDIIPGYADRLAVLPGITGLAQLNLPPDSDDNSVRRKVFLDRQYVEQASLFLDIRILLCTFARVFKLPALTLLRIQRAVPDFNDELTPVGEPSFGEGKEDGDGNGKATLDGLLHQVAWRRKHLLASVGGSGNGHGNGRHATKSKSNHKPR